MAVATERNYYEILGVKRGASAEEIRRAYLDLAKRHHPDKTGGDKKAEEKLKEINAAYDTLKNPDKRKQYDQQLDMAEQFGTYGTGAGNPFGADVGGGFGSVFEDLFGSVFSQFRGGVGSAGGGQSGDYVEPGEDLETGISISLREAVLGTSRKVRFHRPEVCDECHGSGAVKGNVPETCPDCHGSGMVTHSRGAFQMSRTCPRCNGRGQFVKDPCSKCRGTGVTMTERELSVSIPPGIDNGMRLRLAGEGGAGRNGGPRGNLYVRIVVEKHEFLTREGNSLVCEVPVPFVTAAVGGTVKVPTLEGSAELNIPEGTQTGTRLRMRGLGIPSMGRAKQRGDQIVVVRVETPTRLTRRQREILCELAKPGEVDNYPLYRRFINRLKRAGEAFAASAVLLLGFLLSGCLK